MNIDKKKCSAWIDLSFEFFEMTKKLNKNEKRYIQSIFSMVFGHLELQELEMKNGKEI